MASSRRDQNNRIKVSVRLRPFTRTEKLKAGGKAAWTWHENTLYQQIFPAQIPSRSDPNEDDDKVKKMKSRSGKPTTSSSSSSRRDAGLALPSSYSFDYLYPPATQTQTVYQETVKDAIMAAMEGYHSSVFLYGQTGTGKTYTMQGGRGDPGIIQLAVQDIFDNIARHSGMEFLLRFSYLEIYNERIHDLLAAGAKSDIKIYDVHHRGAAMSTNTRDGFVTKDVVIKGLREEIVLSTEHVLSLVELGNLHRHMATTESNDQSSRSHVVFRMVNDLASLFAYTFRSLRVKSVRFEQRSSAFDLVDLASGCCRVIESQDKRSSRDCNEVASVRSATLNIVDLAGSESVRLANTTGQALEEGKFINRSLLTLGHIIWKLSRDRHRTEAGGSRTLNTLHLPYRNSKLTRILQPSLGGQAQIAIVCTASPSVECLAETHNTLKFASRARRVRNRVVINDGLGESALLRKYRARIRELEDQLDRLQMSSRRPAQTSSSSQLKLSERQMELTFAINNINKVILNSSPTQARPDDEELASVDEDPPPSMASLQTTTVPSEVPRRGDSTARYLQEKPTPRQIAARRQVEVEVQASPMQSRIATRPLRRQTHVRSTEDENVNWFESETKDGEVEEVKEEDHARRRLVRAGDSANTSSKTLISGGSASTKTLPLSTSSSRYLTDNDDEIIETKENDHNDEENEAEDEENARHGVITHSADVDQPSLIAPSSTFPATATGLTRSTRPSLTSLLKTKYLREISDMTRRTGRWQCTDEDTLNQQMELLHEFVRGLEIAQAEQETRMSKIRELELENQRLRQTMASRKDGLAQAKTSDTTS